MIANKLWIVRFNHSVRFFYTEYHAEQFARALQMNGMPFEMVRP